MKTKLDNCNLCAITLCQTHATYLNGGSVTEFLLGKSSCFSELYCDPETKYRINHDQQLKKKVNGISPNDGKKHRDPQPNIWWGLGNPVEGEGRIVGIRGIKNITRKSSFPLTAHFF